MTEVNVNVEVPGPNTPTTTVATAIDVVDSVQPQEVAPAKEPVEQPAEQPAKEPAKEPAPVDETLDYFGHHSKKPYSTGKSSAWDAPSAPEFEKYTLCAHREDESLFVCKGTGQCPNSMEKCKPLEQVCTIAR